MIFLTVATELLSPVPAGLHPDVERKVFGTEPYVGDPEATQRGGPPPLCGLCAPFGLSHGLCGRRVKRRLTLFQETREPP